MEDACKIMKTARPIQKGYKIVKLQTSYMSNSERGLNDD